ncbi:MAG: hypothetical protein NC080_07295 [Paraprevotella sp.]|nr:hypothetical protein [Paraprevotella sp.]
MKQILADDSGTVFKSAREKVTELPGVNRSRYKTVVVESEDGALFLVCMNRLLAARYKGQYYAEDINADDAEAERKSAFLERFLPANAQASNDIEKVVADDVQTGNDLLTWKMAEENWRERASPVEKRKRVAQSLMMAADSTGVTAELLNRTIVYIAQGGVSNAAELINKLKDIMERHCLFLSEGTMRRISQRVHNGQWFEAVMPRTRVSDYHQIPAEATQEIVSLCLAEGAERMPKAPVKEAGKKRFNLRTKEVMALVKHNGRVVAKVADNALKEEVTAAILSVYKARAAEQEEPAEKAIPAEAIGLIE